MKNLKTQQQSGFALALTLVLILLTALTLGALFGLLGVTLRVTKASETAARESRAADAAVEAAIVAMREDPDSCARSSQGVLSDQVFDQDTTNTDDDVAVDVECEPVGGSAASSDQVRIVGADGYQGKVKWKTDCSGSAVVPNCTPWSKFLSGTPFDLATSRPGIVHTGPESLRFASGVTVRTGVAAVGSSDGGVSAKPALTVSGQFTQGSPGLKRSAGDDPGAQNCGLLGLIDTATFVLDRDTKPVCDSADAQAVASDPTGIEADSGLVASVTRPPIPTTCTGSVMTFQPGTYDAAMVDSLNSLLDGSKPACKNKTFWFSPGTGTAPGIYSFDAPSLKFADAGSTYVFGAPLGWDTTSGVPSALAADATAPLCDQDVSGSTLVLSARTAFNHTAGRLSVCPSFASNSEPYPALYQTTSVPNSVKLQPAGSTTPGDVFITKVFNCDPNFDYIDVWGSKWCYPVRNYDYDLTAQGSAPLKSLRVLLTGSEGNQTQNNFVGGRSVTMQLFNKSGQSVCNSTEVSGTPNGKLTLSYELITGNCVNALENFTAADLDGMKLRVSVKFSLVPLVLLWPLPLYPSQTLMFTGADTQVNPLSGLVDGSLVTSAPGAWTNVSKVTASDGALAEPVMSCGQLVCSVPLATPTRNPLIKDNTRRFEMTVSGGFTFAGLGAYTSRGVDPRLESLRVDVDLATSQVPLPVIPPALTIDAKFFRADLNARLELQTPSGVRCVAHDGGVNGGSKNEIQRLSFSIDTLDDLENGGSCNASIRTFEELADPASKLKLAIDMPCVRNPDPKADGLCFQLLQNDHIWEVRPPSVDRIAVSATTDSYIGDPANSSVVIDATAPTVSPPATPPTPRMFRSLGRAWLPLTDLDIHWLGDGGTTTLFNNDLVLHGLGSDMVPGATTAFVCCGKPDTREVRIRAIINGRSQLVATVRYTDVDDPGGGAPTVYDPGHEVHVLDWRRGRLTRN